MNLNKNQECIDTNNNTLDLSDFNETLNFPARTLEPYNAYVFSFVV
jgi:hypothetical protein